MLRLQRRQAAAVSTGGRPAFCHSPRRQAGSRRCRWRRGYEFSSRSRHVGCRHPAVDGERGARDPARFVRCEVDERIGDVARLADAAQLASLADATPEGRSIVVLAKEKFNIRGRELAHPHAIFVPFTAQTRMSGVDLDGRSIRKGAADSMKSHIEGQGGTYPAEVAKAVEAASRAGRTPLIVAEGCKVLGVVELKDVVKGGIKDRFAQLRKMGIKTVMITGDNPLTAAAIAAEAGVDDFLAQADRKSVV